ncbi:MAG: hypothetical protein OEV41_01895, partial [Gammaproteobacteria bacterium]|nr:hypothetical protein [Gammaproteobacteria bacterium]
MLYFDAITPNRPLSIAVLPFENLSPAPGDAYFASGLHQEVLDRLSLVSGLQVISRNAVQRFAGSPTAIADTAREYRADAVLEGTVKYQDDRVSISIHLVDPKSGVQTWSSTYEREFSDILDIQQDIARSVAGTLGVTLGVAGGETKDIDAYRAYLAGLDMLGKPRGEDRASSFFRRATDLDPGFAAAWTQLGFATVIRAYFAQPEDARGILEDARSILVRATDLDPQSARAAATLGFVRYSLLDWIGAEEDFARAIDTQANAYTLNQHAGMLVRAGRISAAKSEFDAATSADPSNSQPGQLRRHISVVEQDYSEARDLVAMDEVAGRRQQLLLAIALSEGQPDVIRNAMTELIAVQGEAGPMLVPLMRELESPERALAIIRDAYANGDLQWPSKQYNIALFAAYFGDPELALAAVSADVRMTTVRLWILWYPLMSDVRLLPGFKDLVRALGLPSYWRAYGWPDACAPLGEGDFRCW